MKVKCPFCKFEIEEVSKLTESAHKLYPHVKSKHTIELDKLRSGELL